MYSVEVISPNISFSAQRRNVNKYVFDNSDGLSGIDLGKFFSRTFHLKGIIRKAPRMLVGATTGYLTGGGWSGAAAGAVSAGAFKREAGSSLFQDIYRGGLYGMIGGGVIGGTKVMMGKSQDAGLIGKGYDYIRQTFFGPKPTVQYSEPIGPVMPKINTPQIQGPCLVAGECPIPKSSNMWGDIWEGTKNVIANGLPVASSIGGKALEYMSATQQAKAEEYKAQTASMAGNIASMMGPGYTNMGFMPSGAVMPGVGYSGIPSGVASDITGGSASAGGGVAYPITPQEGPGGEAMGDSVVSRIPVWVYVGGGAVLLYLVLK